MNWYFAALNVKKPLQITVAFLCSLLFWSMSQGDVERLDYLGALSFTTVDFQIGEPVQSGCLPKGMEVDPTGKFLFVANMNGNCNTARQGHRAEGSVSIIDIQARKIEKHLLTPRGGQNFGNVEIVFTPDGHYALAVRMDGDENSYGGKHGLVNIINTKTHQLVRVIPTRGSGSKIIAVKPSSPGDPSIAYVANWFSNDVSVLDLGNLNQEIFHEVGDNSAGWLDVPGDHAAYVTRVRLKSQNAVDNKARKKRGLKTLAAIGPRGIIFIADGRYALILGYNSKTIFVVDTASHRQIAEIPPMPPRLTILVNPTFQTLYRNTPYKKFVAGGKKWFSQGDEKNQAKYVGEIQGGVPRGHGTISFPQGDRYVGDFKDGRYHGQGTYTRTDGSTRTGEWSNGAFTGPNNNYNVRHAVTNNEGTIAYISHMKGNGISRINLRALIALIDAIPEEDRGYDYYFDASIWRQIGVPWKFPGDQSRLVQVLRQYPVNEFPKFPDGYWYRAEPNTIVLEPVGNRYLFVSFRTTCRGYPGICKRTPASQPGKVDVIDTNGGGQLVMTLKSGTEPTGLAITPDGKTLMSSGFRDNKVFFYDVGRMIQVYEQALREEASQTVDQFRDNENGSTP